MNRAQILTKEQIVFLWERISTRCIWAGNCFVWQGAPGSGGYGTVRGLGDGRSFGIHRIAYAYVYGLIPEGKVIDHVKERGCRFRTCCNVRHLEVVTQQVNVWRGDGLAARNRKKIICPAGHMLSGDNLLPNKLRRGERACRICCLEKQRQRRSKVTAADDNKVAMIAVHNERHRLGFVPRMTVHDAIGGDLLDPATLPEMARVLNEPRLESLVPILWESGCGPTWADAKV